MAVRAVRIWPDPALKEVALPIAVVDTSVGQLVDDLFETMYAENGVGLAATQIAVPKRIIVIDLDPRGEARHDEQVRNDLASWGFAGPTAFVNPEIIEAEGSVVWEEGCLSVPGITDKVKRRAQVCVRAQNRQGETFEVRASGLYAVALQHEIDHLDGKVFVDYLSKLKRDVIKRKMQRLKAEEADKPASDAVAL